MKILSKFFLSLTYFSIAIFLVSGLTSKPALASNSQLSGSVVDSLGNGVEGAKIDVLNPGTNINVASTATDSFGNYSISLVSGTYDIKAMPPENTNFTPAIAKSKNLFQDAVVNFIFVPAGTVTLSGHVYDSLGNPLPNQTLSLLAGPSPNMNVTTDVSGSYMFQALPGTYGALGINSSQNNLSFNIPRYFNLTVPSFSLTQSIVLDITIPVKKVDMHIQDASGNPIENVELHVSHINGFSAPSNSSSLSIGGGITNAGGTSYYEDLGPVTDTSGNAIVWLFPNDSVPSHAYQLIAIPPTGTGFITTTSNFIVTDDTQKNVTMLQPVTLSGHVYDPYGNPLVNQTVGLFANGASVKTGATGDYSLQVAPGTYGALGVSGSDNPFSLNVPQNYNITVPSYIINQSTVLDITIPAKKVIVHIQDSFGNPINNVDISTQPFNTINSAGLSINSNINNATGGSYYNIDNVAPRTDIDGNAVLWLLPTNLKYSYSITAVPSAESPFSANTLSNVSITGDVTKIITLQQPVTLSGHVYDSLGNPVANQTLSLLAGSSSNTHVITDASGSYEFHVSSGTYGAFGIAADNNNLGLNIPQYYSLSVQSFSLTQNTILDVTLPTKKVTVHMRDAVGNPLKNVELQVSHPNGTSYPSNSAGLSIGGNITNAVGNSLYGINVTGPKTNDSGDAVLWLFPNDSDPNHAYKFTAIAPAESIYSSTVLNNIIVNSDQTELVSLQFVHGTPSTTATLSPAANRDGNYSDPAEVSLAATAASGYSIANTYYTIDGGTRQDYTAPFTVSGNGDHTITFWSVDNAGVPEASNIQTFTIKTNNSPVFDVIGNKTVGEGQLLQFTVSASDPDGDILSYAATNLPQGATFDPQARVFSWQPDYNQGGNYENIEFTAMDDGSPMALDVELITITVGDVNRSPMFIDTPGPQEVLSGSQLTFSVSATDPDNNAISLSSSNLPTGSAFDAGTGAFSWTPSSAQEGFHVITFAATDDGAPIAIASLDVAITVGHNPTPVEQADSLVDEVITADISDNVENSYLANLQKVAIFIEQGKIRPAINQLAAFVQKVEQDYTQGIITLSQRDDFIAKAQRLIDILSGN